MRSFLQSLIFSFAFIFAASPPVGAEEPVAVVNGKTLTSEDLSLALGASASRVGEDTEPLERASTVLRDLIIEHLAEEAYVKGAVTTGAGKPVNSKLAIELADRARRRALVDAYLTAKLVRKPITQQDVDQFVRDNPDYFGSRKTYHYSDIYIAPRPDMLKSTLEQQLRPFDGRRDIRPEHVRELLDWLTANEVRFSHSKQWDGSEQIKPASLDLLKSLERRRGGAQIKKEKDLIQLVVLYDAYPDPISPAHVRTSIISQLQEQQAREQQIKVISDSLIGNANVQIFDKNVEAVIEPVIAAEEKPLTINNAQKASWTIQFGLLLVWVFAGWSFFKQAENEAILTIDDSALKQFSYSLPVRLVVVISVTSFILTSAVYVLPKTDFVQFPVDVIVFGILGVCIAAGIILSIWKVPFLNWVLNKKRFTMLGAVVFAQFIPLLLRA